MADVRQRDVPQNDHHEALHLDLQETFAAAASKKDGFEWVRLEEGDEEELDAYEYDLRVDDHIRKAALQQLQNNATRQDMHKWYDVLGLQKHAKPTAKDIKDAYRRCAKQRHPDRCTGDKEEFQKLGEAHDILGNSELKKLYDWRGSPGVTQHQAKEFRKKAEDTEGGGLVATLFSFLGFGQGGGRR